MLLAFTIDSLSYFRTSTNPPKVEVHDANLSITTANIPATVTYQGTTYSVTSIGDHAFNECSSLTSVTIPNSVTSIGNWAFSNCCSLTSVNIPNSVTSIGNSAFNACSSLTTLNFNAVNCEGFASYSSEHPFKNCPITTINIGDSVERIPAFFAYNLDSLTSITIPNSVTSIGADAFWNCSSLTSVSIGNGVTSIGSFLFYDCSSLTSITIPNSVTSIGNYAFKDCSSLTSIDIPNSVTFIGEGAFYNCSSLTSITIPNSVTEILDNAFYNCSSLISLSIDFSVSNYRFSNTGLNISILQNLTFGENVISIGSVVFNNCSLLQNVTCLATTPPILAGNTVFPYPNIATLTVPCGTLEAYSAPTSLWNVFFAGRIEEDCGNNDGNNDGDDDEDDGGDSGIEDVIFEDLSVYPNPTRGKVSFNQAIEKVEVIDLSGKTLQTYENANEINIESLPAGVYHLRMTIEDKTTTRKVIKE